MPELAHQIDVMAVRRLQGCIQIHHQVSTKDEPKLTVEQEVASHGLDSAYPRIWSSASVNAGLVLEQVSAVCRTFRTRHDLAHFRAEEDSPSADADKSDATRGGRANTLSMSEAAQVIDHLAREILGHDFFCVPRFSKFALWAGNIETEGFRHLAYLQANETRTLAHIVLLALPSHAVASAFRSESGMRMLMVAPKSVLYAVGRPVLLPMHEDCSSHSANIRLALHEYMREHPPNRLPS